MMLPMTNAVDRGYHHVDAAPRLTPPRPQLPIALARAHRTPTAASRAAPADSISRISTLAKRRPPPQASL